MQNKCFIPVLRTLNWREDLGFKNNKLRKLNSCCIKNYLYGNTENKIKRITVWLVSMNRDDTCNFRFAVLSMLSYVSSLPQLRIIVTKDICAAISWRFHQGEHANQHSRPSYFHGAGIGKSAYLHPDLWEDDPLYVYSEASLMVFCAASSQDILFIKGL